METNPINHKLGDYKMGKKSYKVCALVYPTNSNGPVTGADNDTKKALRTVRSSLTAHYGRPTYTSWGDNRGKDASGNDVLAYAITIEVDKDTEMDWFRQEFLGSSDETYVEVIPGVGYFEKAGGRAKMVSFDTENADDSVAAICETMGVEVVAPTKRTRTPKPSAPADPFGTLGELLSLCHETIEDFDLAANLTTPRPELVAQLEGAMAEIAADPTPEPEADDAAPEADAS
jgi:hypothetical protein